MIFHDGLFPAGSHLGTFLVTRDHRLVILDSGDTGRVTSARLDQLARMALLAIGVLMWDRGCGSTEPRTSRFASISAQIERRS